MKNRIKKLYARREEAYAELLSIDIEIDKILKKLINPKFTIKSK